MTTYSTFGPFLADNFKDILYITGAIISFFIGRKIKKLNLKRTEVRLQSGELGNVETALKIYRTMLTDLGERLKEAEAAADDIERRYLTVLTLNKELILENKELKNKLNETTSYS